MTEQHDVESWGQQVFTSQRQVEVRAAVLAMAADDPTIVGAAVTGSCARGTSDRWSDVDLFFGYDASAAAADVVERWTAKLDASFGVVHYFDLRGHDAIYRAFLLEGVLEIDIGFTDQAHFYAVQGEPFDLAFGATGQQAPAGDAVEDARTPLGYAWHHLIHARVGVERSTWWQALHWTNALRDVITTMMCRRLDLPTSHSKGVDRLPSRTRSQLIATVPTSLTASGFEWIRVDQVGGGGQSVETMSTATFSAEVEEVV